MAKCTRFPSCGAYHGARDKWIQDMVYIGHEVCSEIHDDDHRNPMLMSDNQDNFDGIHHPLHNWEIRTKRQPMTPKYGLVQLIFGFHRANTPE